MLQWYCGTCDRTLQPAEIVEKRVGQRQTLLRCCPHCDELVGKVPARPKRGFTEDVVGSFRYPLQKEGILHIAGLSMIVGASSFILGKGWILSMVLVAGYLGAIVRKSISGDEDLPTPGDDDAMSDSLSAMLRYGFALLAPFVPGILAGVFDEPRILIGGLVLLGVAYLPASLLLASLVGSLVASVNVLAAVRLGLRIPRAYAVVVALVGVLGLAEAAIVSLVWRIPSGFLFAAATQGLLTCAFGLYLPMVVARVLGLLLFHHQDEVQLGD